jgi:hypothetical protein
MLALDETTESEVGRLLGSAGSLWGKSFTLSVSRMLVRVPADADLPAETVALLSDTLIHADDGSVLGTVRELTEHVLTAQSLVEQFARDGTVEHKGFLVEWTRPANTAGVRFHLKKLNPERLRPIDLFRIDGTCRFTLSEFPLRRGRLGDVQVAWATGELLDRPALLVASRAPGSQERISVTVSGSTVSVEKGGS